MKLAISLHDDLQGADEIDFIPHSKSLRHGICVGWSAWKVSTTPRPRHKISTQKVTRHNPGGAFNLSRAKFAAKVCTRKIIPVQINLLFSPISFIPVYLKQAISERDRVNCAKSSSLVPWIYESEFHVQRGASGRVQAKIVLGSSFGRQSGPTAGFLSNSSSPSLRIAARWNRPPTVTLVIFLFCQFSSVVAMASLPRQMST